MTKCQCELMVYRQNLRAQTAITEIHLIHPDIVFDLRASFTCTDDVFSHVKPCRVLVFYGCVHFCPRFIWIQNNVQWDPDIDCLAARLSNLIKNHLKRRTESYCCSCTGQLVAIFCQQHLYKYITWSQPCHASEAKPQCALNNHSFKHEKPRDLITCNHSLYICN